MRGLIGEPVHGEAIIDGDASGGIAVVLYKAGTTTVRTLAADEWLHICHVIIGCETGGDVAVAADSKAAGRYLYHATMGAKGREWLCCHRPFVCPKGKGLKLFGIATNLNTCIVEGFITGA